MRSPSGVWGGAPAADTFFDSFMQNLINLKLFACQYQYFNSPAKFHFFASSGTFMVELLIDLTYNIVG